MNHSTASNIDINMEISMPKIIQDIVTQMHFYQKMHNIKEQCIQNVSYLIDNIRTTFPSCKAEAKAVIVVSSIPEKKYNRITIHMIIRIDKYICDPSYEIASLENSTYYDNFTDYKKSLSPSSEYIHSGEFKNDAELLSSFLKFIKHASDINNGDCLVCNKDIYHKQADYIEKCFS